LLKYSQQALEADRKNVHYIHMHSTVSFPYAEYTFLHKLSLAASYLSNTATILNALYKLTQLALKISSHLKN